jgi:hypothetical protein
LLARLLLGGPQGGDGFGRLLLCLLELADLARERIRLAAQAIDLVLRCCTRGRWRRCCHRLQLQAQWPIDDRPSQRQHGDGARADHDRGERPQMLHDPAAPPVHDRHRTRSELLVERFEPRHPYRVQSIRHAARNRPFLAGVAKSPTRPR